MTAAASSAGTAAARVEWVGGDLVITRVFTAPRETVFAAWTQPEHFARWWGPHDSTTTVRTMDVRPGGSLHFCHHFAEGDFWIGAVYREVAPPERIAFDTFFTDESGGRIVRPGFPEEMTITVTFSEHADGTLVTARHQGLVEDQGEIQGWTETLERLATLLAGIHAPTGDDR
jgi:uncharacterized protein YndB with AHSA1/START domain